MTVEVRAAGLRHGVDMQWLDVAMEEYKTLRQEVQTSLTAQHTILSFGTATLGLVFGAAVNLWDEELAPIVLFSLLIPLLSGLVLLMWLSEAMRMVRAGNYLAVLEQDIAAVGEATADWPAVPPLRWECRLRLPRQDRGLLKLVKRVRGWLAPRPIAEPDKKSSQTDSVHRLKFGNFVLAWPAVFQIVCLIALASLVIGFVNDAAEGKLGWAPYVFGAIAAIILAFLAYSARGRWETLEEEYRQVECDHRAVRPELRKIGVPAANQSPERSEAAEGAPRLSPTSLS